LVDHCLGVESESDLPINGGGISSSDRKLQAVSFLPEVIMRNLGSVGFFVGSIAGIRSDRIEIRSI